jgi:rhodanese-related sulfurtransferase
MEVPLLISWCVCAAVALILFALALKDLGLRSARCEEPGEGHLHYVVISPALLSEWEGHEPNLIVVDLRPKPRSERHDDGIMDALWIPVASLASALCWIPPATRLVFYGSDGLSPFNAAVEEVLLCAGIEAVYLLDGGIGAWHAFMPQNGALLHGSSAHTLRDL